MCTFHFNNFEEKPSQFVVQTKNTERVCERFLVLGIFLFFSFNLFCYFILFAFFFIIFYYITYAHIKLNKLNFEQTTNKTLCKSALQVGMKVSDIYRWASYPARQPASHSPIPCTAIKWVLLGFTRLIRKIVLYARKTHSKFKRISEKTKWIHKSTSIHTLRTAIHVCMYAFFYLFYVSLLFPCSFVHFYYRISYFYLFGSFDLNKFF